MRRRPILRRRWPVVVVVLMCAAHLPGAPASARPPLGGTRVFATLPHPGQPAGVAVDRGRVLTTSMGLLTQPMTAPALFVVSPSGNVVRTVPVGAAMPASAMQLFGVATDAIGRAYVVDMNGRVLRIDPRTGAQQTYSEFPASVGGVTTMPVDLTFTPDGTGYVTDQNLAAIWRVPPGGGAPEVWFQDERLAGYLTGPTGIRIDPSGEHLYFTVAASMHPATARQGLVLRLPVRRPSADALEVVFRYPAQSSPFGIAFGESGRLYVALFAAHQVSELSATPAGLVETARFPSAEQAANLPVPFDRPAAVAFDGKGSLIVSNSNALTVPDESRWVLFDIELGDRGHPLAKPWIP